jgi:hypothetical protein
MGCMYQNALFNVGVTVDASRVNINLMRAQVEEKEKWE